MAYKIVFTIRCYTKLSAVFAYLDNNFPKDTTKNLVERIEKIMMVLGRKPTLGIPSRKVSGVYSMSISRGSKLYYKVKGRKVIVLDLIAADKLSE